MTGPRTPYITEHALLRYLERVQGIDVAFYRAELEAKVALAVKLEASAIISGGFRFVLDDVRLVTVTPAHQAPARRNRHQLEDDA